ncbi:hypothetical protein DPMN_071322 [Dreissena polymorpha]|uniref:Uncharacterized protein n=1 Tax=Dreissena polymorpha TaxID=45954 RepID=A0A9D3Z6I4_DREPO|nr:hypothetical protein DPMN_071322 [Dreissena polymorpha]
MRSCGKRHQALNRLLVALAAVVLPEIYGPCFQLEKPSLMELPSTFVLPILPVFLATMQRWQNARSRL